jgi:hypothetical protein
VQEFEVLDMIAHERGIIEAAYSDLHREMFSPRQSTDYVHGRSRPRGKMHLPHGDWLILHAPGICEDCDAREDWQLDRIRLRIAFTVPDPTGCVLTMEAAIYTMRQNQSATRPDPWALTMRKA